MTREELEHIIRASGNVTDQYEFMIVGSQSILGSIPNPEAVFTMSAEADIYPLHAPELADKIEGALGEGSQFHDTYGYYAQGVGPGTKTARSVSRCWNTPTSRWTRSLMWWIACRWTMSKNANCVRPFAAGQRPSATATTRQ